VRVWHCGLHFFFFAVCRSFWHLEPFDSHAASLISAGHVSVCQFQQHRIAASDIDMTRNDTGQGNLHLMRRKISGSGEYRYRLTQGILRYRKTTEQKADREFKLTRETTTRQSSEDIGHEVGEHNIQALGLDIHNPVFVVSAILAIALVAGTLLFQEQAAVIFSDLRSWITSTFDWFFIISANVIVLFCFGVAFSSLGRVRLGGVDAKPRYGYPGWLAMLFAAGVGIGLMFFGVLEPVTHTLNTPLGIDPADAATARAAGMSAAIFHWGLHAWAIYAVVGLSLAFFCFNRGMPLTLRSAFYPLFGKAVWGVFGHVVDIVAVLATLLGLAVSLGFGAEQIAGGLNYLFDVPTCNVTKFVLILLLLCKSLVLLQPLLLLYHPHSGYEKHKHHYF
jgi:hypothetical protein